MTKPTIIKTWVVGLLVLVAGFVVGGISLALMLAVAGTFTPAPSGNGYDFTPSYNGAFWTAVAFMILGFTAAAAGGVVQLVAWIGALVNTYQIADKTWFGVLLGSGLLGLAFGLLGFAGMVAYLVAGPDGTAIRQPQLPLYTPTPEPAPQPPTFAYVG
ncbi:MAG TPA: hypothetical protein VGP82_03025 [Ktedonobacterales bacterium]|nr:hypothetical protein [Ktedonobacterales bacterium]